MRILFAFQYVIQFRELIRGDDHEHLLVLGLVHLSQNPHQTHEHQTHQTPHQIQLVEQEEEQVHRIHRIHRNQLIQHPIHNQQ